MVGEIFQSNHALIFLRNAANFLVAEIENPKETLPLAVMIAVPIVMVAYVLMNIAYLGVLPMHAILSGKTPAAIVRVAQQWGSIVIYFCIYS